MKKNKTSVLNLFNIVLLVIALIQYYLMTPINTPPVNFLNTLFEYDFRFKLIPGFLIPYFSVYIMLIMVFIMLMRRDESFKMTIFLVSLVFLWSIVNLFHGLLQTQNFVRPEIKETGLFFQLVTDLYTSVKPYRTLPNWHTATAVLCTITYLHLTKKKKILMIVWCVLICASPLFLKMAYLIDVFIGAMLGFLAYKLIDKISTVRLKTESIQEIVKTFSLESLVQSIAIGIRDESTLSSTIEGLTRIEKNLTEKDIAEIREIGAKSDPPFESLKEVINNMILSINVNQHIQKAKELFGKEDKAYHPSDRELKQAAEELIGNACKPFDDPKFRFAVLEIKKKNAQLINLNSMEEAARERSHDIIYRFTSFIESHKKDIPAIAAITNSTNGHHNLTFDEIKIISRELRKPPYETNPDEVWQAYYRLDSSKVKPLGDQKNPANIISLTQYATGKIDTLEPFSDRVDRKFQEWLEASRQSGREFTPDEIEWLKMMKNHFSSFLEINMTSFNQPPFINRGGASKAYNIFGHDLNRILYELNEKLL